MKDRILNLIPWVFATLLVAVLFHYIPALAQDDGCTGSSCGVMLGGTDKSGSLSSLQNIFKTVQVIAIKYAAPVVGSILVFFGIYKIATRDAVVGAIAAVGGGALLFLPKIIEQLGKLGA